MNATHRGAFPESVRQVSELHGAEGNPSPAAHAKPLASTVN